MIFILTFMETLRLLDDPQFSRNSHFIVKINATIISNIRDTRPQTDDTADWTNDITDIVAIGQPTNI